MNWICWFLVGLVALTTVLQLITPRLMAPGECFSVTIPAAQAHDPAIKAITGRYSLVTVGVGVLGAVLVGWTGATIPLVGAPTAGQVALVLLGALLPVAGSFGAMVWARKAVEALKIKRHWVDAPIEGVAVLDEDLPRPLSMAWDLLYIPVLLWVGVLCAWTYPALPAQVPMQMDLAGQVSRAVAKSPLVGAFPLVFALFMAAVFIVSHWWVLRSRLAVEPDAPHGSALASALFNRAYSQVLVAGGLVLVAVLGTVIPLSLAGVVSLAQAGVWALIVALVFAVASVGIAVVYGQSGSRLVRRWQGGQGAGDGTRAVATTLDGHWHLGVFYVDKDDGALVVPKRFGVGWTLNYGRPGAWVATGLLVLAVVGLVAFSLAMG